MKPFHLAATLISNCVRNLRFQRQVHLWPDVLTRYPCPMLCALRWNTWKKLSSHDCESLPCASSRNGTARCGFVSRGAGDECDAADEGKATRLPHDRRMGARRP